MGRRRAKAKTVEDNELHLCILDYGASVNARINHNAFTPHLAWDSDEADPVYDFGSDLSINAKLIYPDERAGDIYDLTFYSADASSRRLALTLKDIQKRDERGHPQYRKYRHQEIPVYSPPKGLGFLNKARAGSDWTGWVQASRRFLNDAMTLLNHEKAAFIIINEHKEERTRWIRSISLQTKEPAKE